MANFENIAKKAFYMGVGFASYAQEKASDTVKDLGVQAQKLAEEMAERGEMSTEEARKFVDDLVEQAQQGTVAGTNSSSKDREPRRIEIVDDVESTPTDTTAGTKQSTSAHADGDDLRQQVQSLQEELRRLKQ
ncbi:MAG: phasin family protein, partial [Waterburya sp.]